MKISQIAARLHTVASELDTLVKKNGFDFPDDMIVPMIQNAFVDINLLRRFVLDSSLSPNPRDDHSFAVPGDR